VGAGGIEVCGSREYDKPEMSKPPQITSNPRKSLIQNTSDEGSAKEGRALHLS